ncbi:PaaI family thioesterase [Nocardia sp. SC052]|uniref:PaaI family thioesterase n=1 Tax=Nocardia sichangensis TaxID=3385975 RepID=UPI0039A0B0DB
MRSIQRQRAGRALRQLAHTLVTTNVSEAILRTAADDLAELANRLEVRLAQSPHESERRSHWNETHPFTGLGSPLAPPLTLLEHRGGHSIVVGAYSPAYEGIPGRVHGGFVAAGFDVAMAWAAHSAGYAGVTGTLTTRFVKPVPLLAPVRYTATMERVQRRKVFLTAVLTSGPECLARAEGVWITPRRYSA